MATHDAKLSIPDTTTLAQFTQLQEVVSSMGATLTLDSVLQSSGGVGGVVKRAAPVASVPAAEPDLAAPAAGSVGRPVTALDGLKMFFTKADVAGFKSRPGGTVYLEAQDDHSIVLRIRGEHQRGRYAPAFGTVTKICRKDDTLFVETDDGKKWAFQSEGKVNRKLTLLRDGAWYSVTAPQAA